MLLPQGRGKESGVGVEFLGGAAEQFSALEEFIDHSGDEDGNDGSG